LPSPDVTPYVDLTLFDDSSQNIYLRALDYALAAFPELQPREGSIETVLLQAMALEVQDAIFAINRVPGAITEILLKLLDIERQAGSRASAVMKFEGDSTASFVVPSGARLFYQANQDSNAVVVVTKESATATHTRGISGISRTGSTVTVFTGAYHGLSVGASVTIDGAGTFDEGPVVVTATPSLTVFSYESATSGAASAGAGGLVIPDSTIPARALIEVETETITEEFNGINAGTRFGLLSIIPSVSSATLATTLLGGRLPESDSEYFTRGIGTLSRLSTGLSTANQIERFVAEGRFSEVYRVKTVDASNQTRQANVAGSVLIVGAPIDASESTLLTGVGDGMTPSTDPSYGVLDELVDAVSERAYASLTVQASHPCFLTVEGEVQVKGSTKVTPSAVQIAALEYLNNYFSSNAWAWSQYARINELLAALSAIEVQVGTATYNAIEYVVSVALTPTKIWLPVESSAYVFDISSIGHNADIVTVGTDFPHGVSIDPGETLYLWVENVDNNIYNTLTLVPALTASGSTFTYSKLGLSTSSSGGRIIAAVKKLASGDLFCMDSAPLFISGNHTITVV
jgi:hypothetical protein